MEQLIIESPSPLHYKERQVRDAMVLFLCGAAAQVLLCVVLYNSRQEFCVVCLPKALLGNPL